MRWLSLLLLLVSFLGFPRAYDEPIKLATHNLAPYGNYKPNTKYQFLATEQFKGYAVNVVNCAFDEIDQAFEVYVMPWTRAQETVKNHQMQGFFAASQKDERDEFAVMSATIAEQKWVWYYPKANPMTPSHPRFKQKALVASFNGANMQSWLRDNNFNVSANPKNTEKLYEMLMLGRLDAVLANNLVMEAIIAAQSEDIKIRIGSKVLQDKPLGVYFSKRFVNQSPGFLTAFNGAVKSCRQRLP